MKFKKDGEVFDGIWGARYEHCRNITACQECGIGAKMVDCSDFCSKKPAEAARLMGYEVVEEEAEVVGLRKIADGIYAEPITPESAKRVVDKIRKKEANDDIVDIDSINQKEEATFVHRNLRETRKEQEANMEKQKPRICEILGVDLWEVFGIKAYPFIKHPGYPTKDYPEVVVKEDGMLYKLDGGKIGNNVICFAINNPNHIIHRPRFTNEEVADARAILRIEHSAWTTLVRKMDNALWLNDGEGGWHELRPGAFPSIQSGQSVKISDIVGGDTE